MQIRRRGRAATRILVALLSPAAIAAGGCAHHRADQYTYAPPYAPPVYPQPQGSAAPTAYTAAVPAGAVPAGVVASAPPMTGVGGQPGEVVVAGGSPCPPCSAQGTEGMVVGATTLIEGGGQTPPCPPAH